MNGFFTDVNGRSNRAWSPEPAQTSIATAGFRPTQRRTMFSAVPAQSAIPMPDDAYIDDDAGGRTLTQSGYDWLVMRQKRGERLSQDEVRDMNAFRGNAPAQYRPVGMDVLTPGRRSF